MARLERVEVDAEPDGYFLETCAHRVFIRSDFLADLAGRSLIVPRVVTRFEWQLGFRQRAKRGSGYG